MTSNLSPRAREMAGEIAAAIRQNGHWQDGTHAIGHWTEFQSDRPVCPVYSPTYERVFRSADLELHNDMDLLLVHLAGDRPGVGDWNDNTPTDEVLARLDRIAAGEE